MEDFDAAVEPRLLPCLLGNVDATGELVLGKGYWLVKGELNGDVWKSVDRLGAGDDIFRERGSALGLLCDNIPNQSIVNSQLQSILTVSWTTCNP